MNQEFRELVWQKGRELYRDMPWRDDTRPYFALVSELMLQQTQVDRVVPKFEGFITAFPDEMSLAQASLADVLKHWQGLGYNRRAKYLHEAAKKIVTEFKGEFPSTFDDLVSLPGVGKNTAGAILAYSFNQPAIFIETNIRTVYLHHFFHDGTTIHDREIVALLEATIDPEHPREWYWALMDYGNFLKRSGRGRLQQSKHYKKQTPLKGSVREVRGQIITALASHDMTRVQLSQQLRADARFESALSGLMKDGLVEESADKLHLTK
ncbi:MAG: mutY [Candidatus Saccharibacteria bacterium]|nr:mutY [Candidatus Saccharibacteria bacterium]